MLSHAQNRTPHDVFVRISTPARPRPNLPWHRRAPWARQPQSHPRRVAVGIVVETGVAAIVLILCVLLRCLFQRSPPGR